MREQKKSHGMKRFISYILATAMVMTSIPGTLWASAEELSDEYLAAPVGGDEMLSDGSEEIANGTGVIAGTTTETDTTVTESDMEAGLDRTSDLLSDGDGSTGVLYAPIYFEKVLDSGMIVKVKVPEDVFPEGTTVKADDVSEEEIESLTGKIKENLNGQLEGEIVKVLVADISFLSKEQITLLPGTDVDVTLVPGDEVKEELKEKEELSLALVYIPADGEAGIVADEKIAEKSFDGITFKAVQFPRYAIVATAKPVEEAAEEQEEDLKEETTEEPAEEFEKETVEEPTEELKEETEEKTEEAEEEQEKEAEQIIATKAEGVRKSYYTCFTAELSGATVTASIPYYYVGSGTTMEASFASTDEYEGVISKANYGKAITDLKAVEIRFVDRRGREASLYNVNLSIQLEDTGAEKYVLYQPYKGWFGTELYQLRTSRSPKFNLYSYTDTYVIAGLKADGIDRTAGVTKRGRTSFCLKTGNANISVDAEKSAFSESVSMEAVPADAEAVVDAVNSVLGEDKVVESIQAFDISFHSTDDGEEVEPEKNVNVTIALPLNEEAEYVLVHVNDDGEAEIVENAVFGAEGVTFSAAEFSVYAVVKESSTEDEARATLKFYGKNNTLIATIYVKNADTENDADLEQVVYDPGAGVIANDELFRGWSISSEGVENTDGDLYTVNTPAKSIEDIREWLKNDITIHEGDVYNIYAMIFKVYNVQFKNEDGVTIHSETLINRNGEAVSYTINTDYTPKTENQQFEGWEISAGEVISPKLEKYPLHTVVQINHDVVFSPLAPPGFWLVFKANDSDGTAKASYTPPQFIKEGEVTSEPADPDRLGYTFGGWYTNPEGTGDAFVFGNELSVRTTVYAKWTPAATAYYTVIVWKQNVSGNGYDFEESITLSGTSNTVINTITQDGATVTDVNGSYRNYKINGTEKAYTGFHADHYDTGKTISSEGSTVVNVYYNRNMIELRFWRFNETNGYTRDYGNVELGVLYYGLFNNSGLPSNYGSNYRKLYMSTDGGLVYPTDGNYNYYYGYYYVDSGPYFVEYSGSKYTKNGSWGQINNYTMHGLYGSTLPDNNYTWPTDFNWYSNGHRGGGVSGTCTTFLDAFLPTSSSSIVNFYGQTPEGDLTITFYKQNADLNGYTVANTVNATAGTFYLSDKYTGYQCAEWSVDGGGTWTQVGSLDEIEGQYYYDANKNEAGHQDIPYTTNLQIRFNRLSYKIKYSDGAYFDGDGNTLDVERIGQGFGESEFITYGASIAAYGDPENTEHYKKPTREGFAFEGWYVDETCTVPYSFTTMPLNGVQVYAKWRLIQYRVFLHPNAGNDPSLDWGDQDMCFRVDYGDKIAGGNKIHGTRGTEYELVGWFTDEACTNPYDFDAYELKSGNPYLAPYNQTEPTELDKYGNPDGTAENKDAKDNRTWITEKLDLYAKWRATMKDARGIQIVYDPGEGTVNAVTSYKDPLYYLDDSSAIATAGAVPEDTTLQFLHWVVQRYDDNTNTFVPTDVVVSPADTFKVYKANAEKTPNPEYNPETDPETYQNIYTIKVVAQYGPKETPTPTHITWYANGGVDTGADYSGTNIFDEDVTVTYAHLQINESIPIVKPDKYTNEDKAFLGWAKYTEPPQAYNKDNDPPVDETQYQPVETGLELFLRYEPDGTFTAIQDGVEIRDVKEIAADENTPYDALYAVWDDPAYIYHTGTPDGNIETIPASWDSYDLTKNVTEGTLYGGYYRDDDEKDGIKTRPDPETKDKTYDGNNWVFQNPEMDKKGTEMDPEAGITYYVKEVPSDIYLQPYMHYTFYLDSFKLTSLWLITDMDDYYYKEVGFVVKDEESGRKAKIAKSVTIKGNNESSSTAKRVTANTVNTAAIEYNDNGTGDNIAYAEGTNLLKDDKTYTISQYWVTPDGLTVTGNKSRTLLTGSCTTKTVSCSEEAYEISIK